MGRRFIGLLSVIALAFAAPLAARAACKLEQLIEIPVPTDGASPAVKAKINGQDVRLIVDTGAFFSLLTPATAASLGLV